MTVLHERQALPWPAYDRQLDENTIDAVRGLNGYMEPFTGTQEDGTVDPRWTPSYREER